MLQHVNPGQTQCLSAAPEPFPEGCPRLNRSPWVEQLEPDPEPHPLTEDCAADVVVIGAGIAGVATAFYLLRDTSKSVVLIERDRVGRGASGHNAGQLEHFQSLCSRSKQIFRVCFQAFHAK